MLQCVQAKSSRTPDQWLAGVSMPPMAARTAAIQGMPSSEFRRRYIKLTKPQVVTVLGRAIGTYYPGATYYEPPKDKALADPVAERAELVEEIKRLKRELAARPQVATIEAIGPGRPMRIKTGPAIQSEHSQLAPGLVRDEQLQGFIDRATTTELYPVKTPLLDRFNEQRRAKQKVVDAALGKISKPRGKK